MTTRVRIRIGDPPAARKRGRPPGSRNKQKPLRHRLVHDMNSCAEIRTGVPNRHSEDLADDLLIGGKKIAMFVYGRSDRATVNKVYRQINENAIPAGWWLGQRCASKAKILAAFDLATGTATPKDR